MWVKGSLKCKDYDVMDFKILRESRKANSVIYTLDDMRVNFSLLRAGWGLRSRGLSVCLSQLSLETGSKLETSMEVSCQQPRFRFTFIFVWYHQGTTTDEGYPCMTAEAFRSGDTGYGNEVYRHGENKRWDTGHPMVINDL